MENIKKIPVHIITGFLGAGKTTFLNELIKSQQPERIVVIENEMGDTNIDGALVVGGADSVVELTAGCICCSLNDELLAEGTARDLVNKIQNMRKDQNFDITDRIEVKLERHEAILAAVEKFQTYIKEEVLANTLAWVENFEGEKLALSDDLMLGIEVKLA